MSISWEGYEVVLLAGLGKTEEGACCLKSADPTKGVPFRCGDGEKVLGYIFEELRYATISNGSTKQSSPLELQLFSIVFSLF